MSTFADRLADRIRTEPQFDADIDDVCTAALCRLVPQLESDRPLSNNAALSRILQSASVFAQASTDGNKALAQDLALYSIFAASEIQQQESARDIISALGNHPGVSQLNETFQLQYRTFRSYVADRLHRKHNAVSIEGVETSLTDFQLDVWDRVKFGKAVAVSAPTSAGKSFVVMEYLCQTVLAHDRFSVVFIAPTRALLSEINGKISSRLAAYPEVRVSTIPTPDHSQRPKQVFILTQERLQVLLAVSNICFDLVVVDEAQSIGDESRGIILQDCLEQAIERSAETRFLFVAPSAEGFEQIEAATGVSSISVAQTQLSPVLQNRIIVSPIAGSPRQLQLKLIMGTRYVSLGVLSGSRGFEVPDTILAAVALELGTGGASLVYGPSPAQTEKIAGRIASGLELESSSKLTELSNFIKNHVHEKFSLATQVLKGVSTHYGKMPSLLREAIEDSFKTGYLKYLVCTTTLFQGINLPARNVFIDTPTRGRKGQKSPLDPAALWNFAGRAGRLGKDVVGNVFLVGYEDWGSKPLTDKKRFTITPSFRKTVTEFPSEVKMGLSDGIIPSQKELAAAPAIRSAVGLMVSRAASGTLRSFLRRSLGDDVDEETRENYAFMAESALEHLRLPAEIIKTNWTIDPFGLARLFTRINELVSAGDITDLIPIHPNSTSADPMDVYFAIYRRINRYVLNNINISYVYKVTFTSLSWMRGLPLPALIANVIDRAEKSNKEKLRFKPINYDSHIRKVFDFIEDQLRFTYVQLGRAYIDLLRHSLEHHGYGAKAKAIYDFPLALELGVSSAAGQAFVELGLSRIAASTFEQLIPNSNPTPDEARKWLAGLAGTEFQLSGVIWEELYRKGLWNPILS